MNIEERAAEVKQDQCKRWHVIYVHAKHEKRVHDSLTKNGVHSFLPLKKEMHQWSDRRKWVEVPLYSGYVFTRIDEGEKLRVFACDGFVKFLSNNGKPSIVPDWQMDSIRKITALYPAQVESLTEGCIGKSGEIIAGVLAGLRGEIVEISNEHYFTIRIEGLDRVLALKVPADSIRIFACKTVPSELNHSGKENISA
ncbi:MAG TPA: UpxY family transcription antiterminator [Candidatus Kryptonia bacterium]